MNLKIKSKKKFLFKVKKNGLLLLICLTSIFFSNCNNKKVIKSELDERLNQQIDLIDTLKSFSLNNGWQNRNHTNWYKIVTYIDGGCGNCIYDLMKWDELISESKYIEVEFVFFIRAIDVKQLQYMLKEINFTHQVIIDKSNLFFTKNLLPEDKRFHTFLVNNENKILLVGNPISALQIKELYFETINYQNNITSPI